MGWGEPVVEGQSSTCAALVKQMCELIIGRNAGHIEDIFQTLYRGLFYRGGPIMTSAISGIEQALWDIKGKYYNAPVYDLLGGPVRDKLRVYGWIGGDKPGFDNDITAQAVEKHEQGFTALKMNATWEQCWIDSYKTIDAVLNRVQAIRDKLGYDMDIALDFHGRVHKSMARILMKELEPLHPLFVEEPVLTENEEAFVELRRHTTIPIATGERNYTRWGFKNIITQGGVDIIQPDLSHAGGILETRKIAAMAEAYDIAVAPHCPLGPIALASCFQLDFCTINAFIQEQSAGMHYNLGADLLDYVENKDMFEFKDGYAKRPVLPGLGVIINEDKVRQMTKVHKYGHSNRQWRNEDGSLVEW